MVYLNSLWIRYHRLSFVQQGPKGLKGLSENATGLFSFDLLSTYRWIVFQLNRSVTKIITMISHPVISPARFRIRQYLVLIIWLMTVAASIFFSATHVHLSSTIDSSVDAQLHTTALFVVKSGTYPPLRNSCQWNITNDFMLNRFVEFQIVGSVIFSWRHNMQRMKHLLIVEARWLWMIHRRSNRSWIRMLVIRRTKRRQATVCKE